MQSMKWFMVMVLGLAACQGSVSPPAEQGIVEDVAVGEGNPVLALVNGEAITAKEIEDKVSTELLQAQRLLYEARRAGVEQVIKERLLAQEAARRGIPVGELIKAEVQDKIEIRYEEVKETYKDKKRFAGKSLSEATPLIRAFLYSRKYPERYRTYTEELRRKAKVEYRIEPPLAIVAEGDHPAIGPAEAPVTIVEFSDYQCPFCGKSRETVNRILDDYKGKIRYVFRDFPLSFHREAFRTHEAAHCAGEQGKYWEYNKKLFANQGALRPDDLKRYATDLRLKPEAFAACLDSGRYRDRIQRSIDYGKKLGASGTPSFFVNGRLLSGARPFTDFQRAIDSELERLP